MSLFELFNIIRTDDLNSFKSLINTNPSLINSYLYGVTPLLYSLECKSEKITMELCQNSLADLELKDNVETSCLEKAIENKMYKIVEIICKNITNKFNRNNLMENGETLLTNSLKLDDQNVSIALIKGGFDVDIPNKHKEYPLQLAIKHNKKEIVKALLQLNKVRLNTLETSYNALADATEKDLTDIAILLIENGNYDLNVSDEDQLWTPLMHAVTNNNEIIVKKLLDKKCDVNSSDKDGNTPLHLAVMTENEHLIKMIVNANPDLSIRNKDRITAKDLAKQIDPELSLLI